MCKWRARARILRIGICGSEQKRSCGAKTADYRDKGDKSLLREDHSVWHSTSMHSVRGVRSDHRKPDGNYRAAIIPAKISLVAMVRCQARQRYLWFFVFAFQLISLRSRTPTFSIGCFSLSRSSFAERRPPVFIS